MLGFEQPKPTFLKAWISSLFIAVPSALIAIYGFHTAPLGTALVAFVGSLIMAYSINQRVSNDWRAKDTLDRYKR
jgi:hypothetical protein